MEQSAQGSWGISFAGGFPGEVLLRSVGALVSSDGVSHPPGLAPLARGMNGGASSGQRLSPVLQVLYNYGFSALFSSPQLGKLRHGGALFPWPAWKLVAELWVLAKVSGRREGGVGRQEDAAGFRGGESEDICEIRKNEVILPRWFSHFGTRKISFIAAWVATRCPLIFSFIVCGGLNITGVQEP